MRRASGRLDCQQLGGKISSKWVRLPEILERPSKANTILVLMKYDTWFSAWRLDLMSGCFRQSNEKSGSMKGGKFLDQMSDHFTENKQCLRYKGQLVNAMCGYNHC